ncbi:MAG: 5-carboxymethyl-2-hydroxymuconate Delta-isomerase [Alphaproteobacteria bacterium]
MPHIIVEYSKNIGDIICMSKLVEELHHTLSSKGIDIARIKTRATECTCVAVGDHGSHGHMIHATLLLLEGRDTATKKQYGDALHAKMHEYVDGVVRHCSVTLEIRDMAKDTYYL